jgi:hypothetical protein
MNKIGYVVLIGLCIFALAKGNNKLAIYSIIGMGLIGAWSFIQGRKKLTKEEKEFIRDNGDVSSGGD